MALLDGRNVVVWVPQLLRREEVDGRAQALDLGGELVVVQQLFHRELWWVHSCVWSVRWCMAGSNDDDEQVRPGQQPRLVVTAVLKLQKRLILA